MTGTIRTTRSTAGARRRAANPARRPPARPAGTGLLLASFLCLLATAPAPLPAGQQETAAAGAATDADTATFIAYNLKNYLRMDRRIGGERVENAPKPDSEIAPLVEIITTAKPDMLGVSEIGSREDVLDLQRRLKDKQLDLPNIEWVDAADGTRHLALLTRFPIVARNSQTSLSYRIDTQTFPFQRGILDVTVEISPDYRLRLLGLHLKSKREIPEADQSLMRRNEAHLLRKHIDAILADSPETNLLVYGDFNDTRNESPIRAIQGRFGTAGHLRDIQLKDKNDSRWTYYWRYADQYSRFDFTFVSKALYPEVLQKQSHIATHPDWFTASDHRALVIKIHPVDS